LFIVGVGIIEVTMTSNYPPEVYLYQDYYVEKNHTVILDLKVHCIAMTPSTVVVNSTLLIVVLPSTTSAHHMTLGLHVDNRMIGVLGACAFGMHMCGFELA
jgi:hypothetical protein